MKPLAALVLLIALLSWAALRRQSEVVADGGWRDYERCDAV